MVMPFINVRYIVNKHNACHCHIYVDIAYRVTRQSCAASIYSGKPVHFMINA